MIPKAIPLALSFMLMTGSLAACGPDNAEDNIEEAQDEAAEGDMEEAAEEMREADRNLAEGDTTDGIN